MIPPDVFDTAVSALSQHTLFISDITEILQRDPDYLNFHFHSAWMWIASILALKSVHLPPSIPQQAEVERLVKAAIERSARDRQAGE